MNKLKKQPFEASFNALNAGVRQSVASGFQASSPWNMESGYAITEDVLM